MMRCVAVARAVALFVTPLVLNAGANVAQGQDIAWSLSHGTNVSAYPELVDFDHDGGLELVFNESPSGRFSVIDLATGAARPLGPIGGSPDVIGLAALDACAKR